MLRGKLLAGIIMIAIISGCAKKKAQNDTEFSEITKKAVQQQSSTADIFEEFYKDDSGANESQASSESNNAVMAKPTPEPASYSFSNNGRYVVQISTVASRSVADRLVEQLDAKGYPAYVAEVQNPTPQLFGTYYRIRIGGFSQISFAKGFGNETLKPLGYDFWVDNKSNDNIGIQGDGFGESSPASNLDNSTYQTYPSYPDPVTTPAANYTTGTPSAIPAPLQPENITPAAPAPLPAIPATPAAPVSSESAEEIPLDDAW